MSSHKRQYSTSAMKIAESEDLLLEILKRLPAPTLLDFRRVCKCWRTLISSSEFRHTWNSTRSFLKPSGLLFCQRMSIEESKFVYLDDKIPGLAKSPYSDFPYHKVNIVQSCNGLILCARGPELRLYGHFVCNPTTRQVVKLSNPGRHAYVVGVSLAFDPNVSPYFKVLGLESSKTAVYVYSSELQAWRSVELKFSIRIYNQRVYYNGVVYWPDFPLFSGISFDIENDKLERMELPITLQEENQDVGRSRFIYMGVCAGRLYLVERYLDVFLYFIVHEMGRDGSSWTIKHQINCGQYEARHLPVVPHNLYFENVRVLCMLEDENGELCMVVTVFPKIVAYSFHSMTVKELHRSEDACIFLALEYFESLSSV